MSLVWIKETKRRNQNIHRSHFFKEARGAHVRGDRGRAMSAPRQCCRSRQKWPWVDADLLMG